MSIYKVLSRSSGTLCRSFTLLSLSWNSQPFSTSLSNHFHSLLHQSPNKVIPIQANLLSALNSSLTWRFGVSSSASPQSASVNKQKLRIKPKNQHKKKAITDNPKKLANLIDLVNLPSTLRDLVGQSQISRLGCFISVWSYIKSNNLQDPNNKNVVNCDEKLKSILLGKPQVELAELPALIKLHFPKESK